MIFDRFASLLVLTCAVMVPIANSAAAIDIEFDYEIWGSQFEGCVGPSAQNGSFFNNQCTNPDTYYLKFTLQATAGESCTLSYWNATDCQGTEGLIGFPGGDTNECVGGHFPPYLVLPDIPQVGACAFYSGDV